MRVLVVLPTYNESATIERIVKAVRTNLPEADVLVVDDSSPDGTAEIARRAGAQLGQVHVLVRPTKDGLGNAYKAGFSWGLERGYEALCEMDSDFSHDPADLPRLIEALESSEAEAVIGSRYVAGGEIPNWSLSRRAISRLGNLYADLVLGLHVKDSTAGFRAYAASVLERLDLTSVRADSYGFQVEMTYLVEQAGATVLEVPIRFVDRVEGTSKMSGHTVTEAFGLVGMLAIRRLLGKRRGNKTARAVPEQVLARSEPRDDGSTSATH
ncbi:MAG: hypothetical protein JWM85_589 [Acidimicrobiaceae bacterium]|nr:hypothetical protein [Acidimicrobiaceae bacterium]